MNYEYKGGESPEERIRNKLSVVFLTVESVQQGNCSENIADRAVRVIPEIIEHIEDIEDFYTNRNCIGFAEWLVIHDFRPYRNGWIKDGVKKTIMSSEMVFDIYKQTPK